MKLAGRLVILSLPEMKSNHAESRKKAASSALDLRTLSNGLTVHEIPSMLPSRLAPCCLVGLVLRFFVLELASYRILVPGDIMVPDQSMIGFQQAIGIG